MTFLFETTTNEFNQISNGSKTFDILKFGKSVSVGDTIIYQRIGQDVEEDGEVDDDPQSEAEISVQITYLFDDIDGCLKKGYSAISFKEKE